MLSSALGVNHNILVFHSLFFLFFFWSLLLFCLFNLLLYICNILFLEVWMILDDFCWCKFIQNFDAKIWVFAIFTEFEWEWASWDYINEYLDNMRLFWEGWFRIWVNLNFWYLNVFYHDVLLNRTCVDVNFLPFRLHFWVFFLYRVSFYQPFLLYKIGI